MIKNIYNFPGNKTRSSLPGWFLLSFYVSSGWTLDRLAVPRFEDYPVREFVRADPAPPRMSTPQQQMYAAQIREGVENGYGVLNNGNEKKGPNFAGNFIVVQWSCGSPCMRMAIVDAQTGEIYDPPISFDGMAKRSFDLPLLRHGQSVPQNPVIYFRPNNSLMIIQATPHSNRPGLHPSYTFYFQWKENGWILLRRAPLRTPRDSKISVDKQ